MSLVKKRRIENPLKSVLKGAGGVSAADAVRNAESALEPLREACHDTLCAVSTRMVKEYVGLSPARREVADMAALYQMSMEAIDASMARADSGLDRAAKSLCDILDRCQDEGRWDWPAVEVHIAGLHLLATHKEITPAERKSVLDDLEKVSRKVMARFQGEAGAAPGPSHSAH